MSEIVYTAQERSEKPKVLRKTGFTPGVLYGEGLKTGVPVKFEEQKINKLISHHGQNAKLWLEFKGNKHFGIIKEVQKDIVSGKIVHIDIHVISQKDTVRIKLPIIFTGAGALEHKGLTVKVLNSKADISGQAVILPEHAAVNVEAMNLGDTIKISDLKLDNKIKVHDPEDEVYATISEIKIIEEAAEQPEAGAEAAEEKAAPEAGDGKESAE